MAGVGSRGGEIYMYIFVFVERVFCTLDREKISFYNIEGEEKIFSMCKDRVIIIFIRCICIHVMCIN